MIRRLSWQLRLSITVGAILSSLLLFSFASQAKAEGPVEEIDSCSLQPTGLVNEVFLGFAKALAPVQEGSSCNSLQEFTYASPNIDTFLESQGIESEGYVYGGASGVLASYNAKMYEIQPANTPTYTRYMAERVGIAPSASAAASMSQALSPVIVIWQMVRNLAYIFMTVIMLILGLLLMIRTRVGGQEPISVVNSMVGVAISLLLITFSYPITSLVADLCINLGNGLVASVFNEFINSKQILNLLYIPETNINIMTLVGEIQQVGFGNSVRVLIGQILQGLGVPLGHVTQVFEGMEGGLFGIIGNISATLSMMIFGIFTGAANSIVSSPLITAIVSFIIFTTMVRMTFGLIFAYFSLAIKVAFSPFGFIGVSFPGGFGSVWTWAKSVMADALVFPTMFAMILMSAIFFNLREQPFQDYCPQAEYGTVPRSSTIFKTVKYEESSEAESCYPKMLPPEFNIWPAPFGYMRGVDPDDFMRAMLGMGMLLVAPTTAAMWKELLDVKEFRFFQMVAGGVKTGVGAFGAMISRVPSFGMGKAIGELSGQVSQSL